MSEPPNGNRPPRTVSPGRIPPIPSGARAWPRRRWRPESGGFLLVLPILVFLVLFFLLPVLLAVSISFLGYDPTTFISGEVTLRNYVRFLTDDFYLDAIFLTFGAALVVTAACAVLGYPIAYHLSTLRTRRSRAAFSLIVFLPLMLSLVITSFAWLVILGDRGLVNQALQFARITDGPVRLHGSLAGVLIVMAYQYIPFYILNVYAALENIDPSIRRAARSLGASERITFFQVTLPLSMPGVVTGMFLVFALTVGSFVTPLIIGLGQVKTIPVFIYNFAIFIFDWPGAAALAGILLVISLGSTYVLGRVAQKRFMAWIK